ncbi:hypothetical protein EYF80_043242 [Liparis tanakae]|uniref:Uncharacterized protein n=1 Tax=Liparis tanakae TaxID=230148 RepID=A0A4Z2FZ26_9TELE|nr:hypothetical protein EYF80_043242 [Liparis tanakae]
MAAVTPPALSDGRVAGGTGRTDPSGQENPSGQDPPVTPSVGVDVTAPSTQPEELDQLPSGQDPGAVVPGKDDADFQLTFQLKRRRPPVSLGPGESPTDTAREPHSPVSRSVPQDTAEPPPPPDPEGTRSLASRSLRYRADSRPRCSDPAPRKKYRLDTTPALRSPQLERGRVESVVLIQPYIHVHIPILG